MAHRQIQTNFRLNAWKGVKGTASNVFQASAVGLDLSPVLEYVIQELYEAGYPSVKQGTFTLVNVYNPASRNSVGYSEAPHKDLVKPSTGLVLTFSMASRPLIKTPAEVFQSRVTDYTVFWGKTFLETNNNLVVSVPKELMKDSRVASGMLDELLILYNIIGMVTKNFVQNEYNPKATNKFLVPNMPLGMLKSKYLELSLPNLVKNVHPMYWPFNLDFWIKANQLLMPRHLVNSLNLYMCIYVLDMLGPRLGPKASDYINGTGPNTLHNFVVDGLRSLMQIIKIQNVPSRLEDSAYGTLHLLYAMVRPGGIGVADDHGTATGLLQGIVNRFDRNPELEHDFMQTFSSIQTMARTVIDGDDSLARFLEEVFSG